MKATKFLLVLIVGFSLFAFNLAACNWYESDGSTGSATPAPGSYQAYDLTATFGADQFHVQLTAIASSRLASGGPTEP